MMSLNSHFLLSGRQSLPHAIIFVLIEESLFNRSWDKNIS